MWIVVVLLLFAGCASHPPAQKPVEKAVPWKWAEENLRVMYPETPRADCIARTLLDWGDAAFFMRHAADALTRYLRARDANPEDFRSYWYAGRAYLWLRRNEDALAAYAHALVLTPRRKNLLETAGHDMQDIGYTLRTDHFAPLARFVGTDISVATDDPRWTGWALCKAASTTEEYRRDKHISEPPGEFSLTVERNCIKLLLELDGRLHDQPAPDVVVLRLRDIAQAGLLDGFIDYELGTRSLPYLANQNPAAAEEMGKFVRAFVLVPATSK